jgi:hypothetical protein
MADIQRKDAQKLLRLISPSAMKGDWLTYSEAAQLLGRKPPERHSRAVAQMCDLLDAAACLAGVPLLALVVVRAKFGKINPKAWKEYGPRRNAIIERSQSYQFRPADIKAISGAIRDLGRRGNRASWKYLRTLYPGGLLYKRVTGLYIDAGLDAIDDIGTDAPIRTKTEVWCYIRDQKVRDAVLLRAKGRCEFCGELGFMKPDGSRYLESHHIIALADDGEDRLSNVIALCPGDHREAHFGKNAKQIEQKMILKLKSINK